MTKTEYKELAASGLATAKIMSNAAHDAYAKGEITYAEKIQKLKTADDYYMNRLDVLDKLRSF